MLLQIYEPVTWAEKAGLSVQMDDLKIPQQDQAQEARASSDKIAPEFDKHFLSNNVFFVSDELLADKDWMYIVPAFKEMFVNNNKVLADSYVSLKDGKHFWGKFNWKSQPAQIRELKTGLIVIYAEKWGGDYYVPPESYSDATNRLWVMAKIINIDNINNGFITVSGPSMVGLDAVRIIQDNNR